MMMFNKVSVVPRARSAAAAADVSNSNQNSRRRRPANTNTRRRRADYDKNDDDYDDSDGSDGSDGSDNDKDKGHNHDYERRRRKKITAMGSICSFVQKQKHKSWMRFRQIIIKNNKKEGKTTMIMVSLILFLLFGIIILFFIVVTTILFLSLPSSSSRRYIGRPMNDIIINEIPVRILSFDYNNNNNNNYNNNYNNNNGNSKRNIDIDIGGWKYIRRFFHPKTILLNNTHSLIIEPDFGGLDIIRINRFSSSSSNNTNTNTKNNNDAKNNNNNNNKKKKKTAQLPPSREINSNDIQLAEKYWNAFHFSNGDPYLSSLDDHSEAIQDRPKTCRQTNWSKQYYPSCNSIHEINLSGNYKNDDPNNNNNNNNNNNTGLRTTTTATATATTTAVADSDVVLDTFYINHGYYRDVWVVHQVQPIDIKSVLKITRWKHKYSHSTYWNTLADAMVMERLTKSPRIVDIYGHCGTAVWVEAIPHEVEEVIVKGEGMAKQDELDIKMKKNIISFNDYTIDEKLDMAIIMAESLADLHGFKDGVIVHDDVQLCQWLETNDGKLKLGDFNRAEVMKYNDKKKEYCKYNNGECYGNYRSPEEYSSAELDEGIDVYTFGNNIYSLLTGLWVFYDTDDDSVVQKKVINGTRAYVDPRWREHSYIENKLVDVMEQCWVNDKQKKRIDIFQVVKLLREIKKENESKKNKNKNKNNNAKEELKTPPEIYNNMMGQEVNEEEEKE